MQETHSLALVSGSDFPFSNLPIKRIYTYILKTDTGFAPNPFHGCCTLACCKPIIRKGARPGDVVVGITPRNRGLGSHIAYVMQIDEVLTFKEYWEKYPKKRPIWESKDPVEQCGDNCYEPLSDGQFRQLPSCHWNSSKCCADQGNMEKDLGGQHVLISKHFVYFGDNAQDEEPPEVPPKVPPKVPPHLSFMIPGHGHKVKFTEQEKREIIDFLRTMKLGRHGFPRDWKKTGRAGEEIVRCCGGARKRWKKRKCG
jgi:hypothetical protein